MKKKSFGLLSILNLLVITALGLAACAQATQTSPATPIPSITPTTIKPTVPPPPQATDTAIPATSTQPPQATAVPATPTSVPTVAVDPDRPNDLTEARLRVSQCVWGSQAKKGTDGLATDVYINGKVPVTAGVPLTNLPPGAVSHYEYLAPGTVNVAVVPTGMGIDTPFTRPARRDA